MFHPTEFIYGLSSWTISFNESGRKRPPVTGNPLQFVRGREERYLTDILRIMRVQDLLTLWPLKTVWTAFDRKWHLCTIGRCEVESDSFMIFLAFHTNRSDDSAVLSLELPGLLDILRIPAMGIFFVLGIWPLSKLVRQAGWRPMAGPIVL